MTFLIVPVVLCAAYLVMVAFCVCNRMTAQTNHFVRFLVAVIGGAGLWALCKAVGYGWGSTPEELIQGFAIVALALVVGLAPRVNTGSEERSATGRRVQSK